MSDTAKKIDHPGRFKTWHKTSDETKTIMSEAKKGQPKPKGSGNPSQSIEVTDIKNNTIISYDSISEAARALNINESSIRSNLKSNNKKPYKKRYMFAYKK